MKIEHIHKNQLDPRTLSYILNMDTQIKFTNSAQPRDLTQYQFAWDGSYGYDKPSPLLFNFGMLLQRVVSQAGTYHFTKKFHDTECGIYKCEGGCRIVGAGDLVLSDGSCYWDHGRAKSDSGLRAMAALITRIVLDWDPMRPVDSMLETAAKQVGCPVEDLRKAVLEGRSGGPFGGNSLSDFFRWNPFSEAPIVEDYERWCWVNVHGGDEQEVIQRQSDRALGKKLLKQINDHIRAAAKGSYPSTALCCSPRRNGDSLRFWINTGTSTQIDGWKSEEEIQSFLASDGVLRQEKRW